MITTITIWRRMRVTLLDTTIADKNKMLHFLKSDIGQSKYEVRQGTSHKQLVCEGGTWGVVTSASNGNANHHILGRNLKLGKMKKVYGYIS